jgi:hypothetical protein
MRNLLSTVAFVAHGIVGYTSIVLLILGEFNYVGTVFLLYSLTSIFVAYFTYMLLYQCSSVVMTVSGKVEKIIEERKAIDPMSYNTYLLYSDIPLRLRRRASFNPFAVIISLLVFGVMIEIPFLNTLVIVYYISRSSYLLDEAIVAIGQLGISLIHPRNVGTHLVLGVITMGASLPYFMNRLSQLSSQVASLSLSPPQDQGSNQGSSALGGTP